MYRILMKFLPKRPEKYTGRNIKNLKFAMTMNKHYLQCDYKSKTECQLESHCQSVTQLAYGGVAGHKFLKIKILYFFKKKFFENFSRKKS